MSPSPFGLYLMPLSLKGNISHAQQESPRPIPHPFLLFKRVWMPWVFSHEKFMLKGPRDNARDEISHTSKYGFFTPSGSVPILSQAPIAFTHPPIPCPIFLSYVRPIS